MNSCIYEGTIRHRRLVGPEHSFGYPLFLAYLDLDELPEVFDNNWLWSVNKPNVAAFHRKDHFGDPNRPLIDCVRDEVEQQTGDRPNGPVRLLTNLRYFGYVMNPVSFYYCWNREDDRVHSLIAEVTNTPWGERHLYVVRWQDTDQTTQRFELPKRLHVSPFFSMKQSYKWRLSTPREDLLVHMDNIEDDRSVFAATLALSRRELSTKSLASCLVRYPAITAAVAAGIYYQAARLRLKGATYHPHPQKPVGANLEAHT